MRIRPAKLLTNDGTGCSSAMHFTVNESQAGDGSRPGCTEQTDAGISRGPIDVQSKDAVVVAIKMAIELHPYASPAGPSDGVKAGAIIPGAGNSGIYVCGLSHFLI